MQRITVRNARFQQWGALLSNRNKRTRAKEFLVQGVKPITAALHHGWTFTTVLYDADRHLSAWARDVLHHTTAEHVAISQTLLAELSGKEEGAAEIVAIAAMPPDHLNRIQVSRDFLGVVFDRPTQPGNIGAMVRSADALGARGLIVTGHGADPYDPQSVRASTGAFFTMPVVRVPSHREVLHWIDGQHMARPTCVALDEHGEVDISQVDLCGPTLLLVGNETAGLSRAWRESADVIAKIPMMGSASSLNASNAASIVLYEAQRQRLGGAVTLLP